jgi:hypothetical protein
LTSFIPIIYRPKKKFSKLFKKNLKNSLVKPSDPGLFFIFPIPKLVNESGNVITDQNQILQEAKIYYENLYSKRDTVSNINLKNEIPYTGIPTLSDEIKDNLEGEITYFINCLCLSPFGIQVIMPSFLCK